MVPARRVAVVVLLLAPGAAFAPSSGRGFAANRKSSPPPSPPLPPGVQESDLRARQAAKQKEAAQVRAKVKQLKKKQAAVTEQLQESQEKLERTTRELKRFNQDLRATAKSLVATRVKLDALKARMTQHLNELTDLLVAYYKNGRESYTQALITSDSLGDFMHRSELVRRVVDSDNELLQIVETEQRMVRQREVELQRHQDRTRQLRVMVADKREEIADAAHDQRTLLNKISRERASYEQYLRELEQSSRDIERLIRRMKAERERQRRARQEPGQPPLPPEEFSGSFIRPVSGVMRSGYGYRVHPIFRIRKLHTGVDLAAPSGTPIRAAAGGTVIISGWMRGYGKTIVIDHGGDTATLYGHCSELLVGRGAMVRQGQQIARVGSTGYSTGPHLHWEVRKNGVPVNPLAQ